MRAAILWKLWGWLGGVRQASELEAEARMYLEEMDRQKVRPRILGWRHARIAH
jgi:hypothetical protein